jgi:hypothetical protein
MSVAVSSIAGALASRSAAVAVGLALLVLVCVVALLAAAGLVLSKAAHARMIRTLVELRQFAAVITTARVDG